MHTLYDVETQIPAFFHITEASVHDTKVMIEIPYEPSSYYIHKAQKSQFPVVGEKHENIGKQCYTCIEAVSCTHLIILKIYP